MARIRGDVPVKLSADEHLELLIGPGRDPADPKKTLSAFPTEEARRLAWEAHREAILDGSPNGAWGEERYDG